MREVDRIIAEAEEALPSYRRSPQDIASVGYKGRVNILRVPYDPLMREAIRLRRAGVALGRAEAVEIAYDTVLRKATDGEWERTGEVHLDRTNKRARAFCSSGGGTPQLVGGGNAPEETAV